MSEININITNMDEQIRLLTSLQQEFCSSAAALPETSGKGPVASAARTLGEKLMDIRENLEVLFEATGVFLNDARTGYLTADEKLKSGYEG